MGVGMPPPQRTYADNYNKKPTMHATGDASRLVDDIGIAQFFA